MPSFKEPLLQKILDEEKIETRRPVQKGVRVAKPRRNAS